MKNLFANILTLGAALLFTAWEVLVEGRHRDGGDYVEEKKR